MVRSALRVTMRLGGPYRCCSLRGVSRRGPRHKHGQPKRRAAGRLDRPCFRHRMLPLPPSGRRHSELSSLGRAAAPAPGLAMYAARTSSRSLTRWNGNGSIPHPAQDAESMDNDTARPDDAQSMQPSTRSCARFGIRRERCYETACAGHSAPVGRAHGELVDRGAPPSVDEVVLIRDALPRSGGLVRVIPTSPRAARTSGVGVSSSRSIRDHLREVARIPRSLSCRMTRGFRRARDPIRPGATSRMTA
jgi:hypothetical protein